MNISQATAQILWETLNGVMYDLSVGNIVDANETVGDLIDMLEQAGANPDAFLYFRIDRKMVKVVSFGAKAFRYTRAKARATSPPAGVAAPGSGPRC